MSVISDHDVGASNVKTYVIGFALSVLLTGLAFGLVQTHVTHHHTYPRDSFVVVALLTLAVIQLFVQLVCFLHVRRSARPRWNIWALAFAATVVVILVIGSMWIMYSLNRRMNYTPAQINQYLRRQDQI